MEKFDITKSFDTMVLERGIVINRTLKYLVPALKMYGEKFIAAVNSLNIKGFVLGDSNDLNFNYIGLIIYAGNKSVESFKAAHVEYTVPYREDLEIMFVKNPKIDKVELFLQGKYSELYTSTEIDRFIKKTVKRGNVEYYTDVYSVLTRQPTYQSVFCNKINQDFHTNHSLEDLELSDKELDYPPVLGQEIANKEIDKLLLGYPELTCIKMTDDQTNLINNMMYAPIT